MIIAAIAKEFPDDGIVGEEDSSDLRKDDKLRDSVWNVVKGAQEAYNDPELASLKDAEDVMTTIDKGTHAGGRTGSMEFYS